MDNLEKRNSHSSLSILSHNSEPQLAAWVEVVGGPSWVGHSLDLQKEAHACTVM